MEERSDSRPFLDLDSQYLGLTKGDIVITQGASRMLVLLVLSRVVFGRSLAAGEGRNEQLCTGCQPCAHSLLPATSHKHHASLRDRVEYPLRPQCLASTLIRAQLASRSMV
jgi:hypothetical protein